jgi:transposase
LRTVGSLAKEYSGVSHYYNVEVQGNQLTKRPSEPAKAIKITFEKKQISGNKLTHPGVYCLRTNEPKMTDEVMWRTYIDLTKVESVFRSLKSELGLRPIYHWKEQRIDGHLFVSILAYQCIRLVRLLLSENNITDSWETIVKTLKTHMRGTIVVKSDTKPTLLMRKTAIPEELHARIYKALNLRLNSGKTIKKRLFNAN